MCKKLKLLVAATALVCTSALATPQAAQDYTPDPVMAAAAKAAASQQAAMNTDTKNHLNTLMEKFKSPEYKAQQKSYQTSLKKQLGLNQWQAEQGEEKQEMPYSDKPVLFVSSSVPMRTLRAFARDMEKVGGVMVLRGGVGGLKQIRPTMQFIASILNVDEDCEGASCEKRKVAFLIDPLLFDAYNISQVPALTYQDKTELISYCDGLELLPKTNAVVYGDATIGFMLKRIRSLTGDEGLTPLIELLGA